MTNQALPAAWRALTEHRDEIRDQRMEEWFRTDPLRAKRFSATAAGLTLDYSRNRITERSLQLLLDLAATCSLPSRIGAMFGGASINLTENRPALHTALRDDGARAGGLAAKEIPALLERMAVTVDAVHSGRWLGHDGQRIETVVNIGIGGSDLGPAMASQALTPYRVESLQSRFLSNIDGSAFAKTIQGLNPATTLFIIESKTFTTQETRENALAARAWCLDHGVPQDQLDKHFMAVSTNLPAAREFGIDPQNTFPLWDFVGGRFSLWSAIGLPLALGIGMSRFRELLAGGRAMDEHFLHAPLAENLPVILALIGIWNINFLGASAQAVIPYDEFLQRFPAYLQQLEMESNGKSVRLNGEPALHKTATAIFGEAGTNTQHSFHQLLHQGMHLIPVDFIMPAKSHHPLGSHHRLLFANCLSQARALMKGKTLAEVCDEMRARGFDEEDIRRLAPHRVIPGNKPSNLILLEQLTPATLGALIALYEHKVFAQSVIWDINAFDQWGVELGKQYCAELAGALTGVANQNLDGATLAGIDYFKSHG